MLTLKLPRLLSIHQVPKVFREKGILFGYRHPKSSATDCLFSVFQMTNETMNIWTHFLPSWYFLWKLLDFVLSRDVWSDRYTWPFLAYMATCCAYPLASSVAHTFSTMSLRARHICYFCDYGALALYSLGSAVAYSAYVFPDEWIGSTFHRYYLSIAVLNTVFSTCLSCYSRLAEAERPKLGKGMRILAFAYPYLYDSIPLFYRLYWCQGGMIRTHCWHTILAWLTCFLFATHLPERLAPGLFDYIGHSHQLFHICGVVGTHFQMEALSTDMMKRRKQLLASLPDPSFFPRAVASMAVCAMAGLLIIAAFSASLYSTPTLSGRRNKSKSRRD
nr:membrane progestin receptor gamma [Anolis sagrei ordinatus]XP_060611377.1 membrane progestin receptor gamma [Anolis sagrei ordinatus]